MLTHEEIKAAWTEERNKMVTEPLTQSGGKVKHVRLFREGKYVTFGTVVDMQRLIDDACTGAVFQLLSKKMHE